MRKILFFLITSLIIAFVSAPQLSAAGDSLSILFKNNTVTKISIYDISNITFSDLTDVDELPNVAVIENYPNPFSETTTIEFELHGQSSVNINIYSQTGELVRHIDCPDCSVGINRYQWDCLNNSGIRVAEGVYFFELINGTERLSKKIVLVR